MNAVSKKVGLMTHLATLSPLTVSKDQKATFFGTVFVIQKTRVTSVVSRCFAHDDEIPALTCLEASIIDGPINSSNLLADDPKADSSIPQAYAADSLKMTRVRHLTRTHSLGR